jgi:endonuclease-3
MRIPKQKTTPSKKQGPAADLAVHKRRAAKLFDALAQIWPNAHCELTHHNEFQLLVAVVLSAQTTDVAVNRSFGSYITKNPKFSPSDLVAMGESRFLSIIKSIGLAPTKARNCFALARQLMDRFEGNVPSNRDDLESLPGVGRKTANVVLNVLFGEPTMAVDTHVARLAVRLGLAPDGVNREVIERRLLAVVPTRHAARAHHYLIFHGRYLCSARKPQCSQCAVRDLCPKVGVQTSS